MVEDTKMEDTSTAADPKKEDKPKDEKKDETPPLPPLEAAARRLERLLGGGSADQERQMYTYGNPVKVTRRWLGTASGASGKATSASIVAAATALLDPDHSDDRTRSLLLAIEVPEEPTSSMEVEADEKEEAKPLYLSMASRREVESWLLSLQVRILWKEEKYTEAMTLVEKGIAILLEQVTIAAKKVTSTAGRSVSTLFPLLARLYRYRSLVADSMKDPAVTLGLRQVMAKAHNMACLRRDVDCQATLINLMLRDLLMHSQGGYSKCFESCPILCSNRIYLNHFHLL